MNTLTIYCARLHVVIYCRTQADYERIKAKLAERATDAA